MDLFERLKSFFFLSFLLGVFACDNPLSNEFLLEDAIPETAVFGFVLESRASVEQFKQGQVPGLLNGLSKIELDSLISEALLNEFSFAQLSLSWHSSSKNELAPLLILPMTKAVSNVNKTVIEVYGLSEAGIKSDYNDFQIWGGAVNGYRLSWVAADGYLVLSSSEVLIEDFIRAQQNESARLAIDQLKHDPAVLYVNNSRLREVFGASRYLDVSFMEDGVAQFSIAEEEGQILFNGFSTTKAAKAFNAPIGGQGYMPNKYEFVHWANMPGEKEQSMAEVGLSVYGALASAFVFPVEDPAAFREQIYQLSETQLASNDSMPYKESYAGQEIYYLASDYFKDFLGAEQLAKGAFCTVADGYAIVSVSDEAIRMCLSSHADETSLGQSVSDRLFIDNLIQDTYHSQIIKNLPAAANEAIGLEQLILQANVTNSGILLNGQLSLQQKLSIEDQLNTDALALKANAFLDTMAFTRPFVLRNHTNQRREILIQDALSQLYQISLEGQVNWKVAIDAPIVTPIYQIDYYNNGKLQYLFASDSLMHLYDRNGEIVGGFPKAHGVNSDIAGFALVDYDRTKRYRYLLETGRGQLYLFDKEVNLLEGWAPLDLKARLLETPYHTRIAGKDFFLSAERADKVTLLNRKGRAYPNFPVDLDMRFSGDVYLHKKPNFASSEISLLSDQGKLATVNLLGKQTRSEQLFRANANTRFELINDVLGNGFLIKRSDDKVTTFLDADQKELFSLDFGLDATNQLYFYRFGNGAEVLMVWNKATSLVKFFDLNGNQFGQVFQSTFKPSLLYFQRQRSYQLFVNLENEVNIYEFSPSAQ